MKPIKILLLLITISFLTNCKVPFYKSTATNIGDSNLPSDLIYLKSYGKAINNKTAKIEAEQNAFRTLLFFGVPGSPQERAIVGDETTARREHPEFYDDFFNKYIYRDYITESTEVETSRDHLDAVVAIKIKINLRAFRIYLENNNIIRKFGL